MCVYQQFEIAFKFKLDSKFKLMARTKFRPTALHIATLSLLTIGSLLLMQSLAFAKEEILSEPIESWERNVPELRKTEADPRSPPYLNIETPRRKLEDGEDGAVTADDGTDTPDDDSDTPEDGTDTPDDGTVAPDDGTDAPVDDTDDAAEPAEVVVYYPVLGSTQVRSDPNTVGAQSADLLIIFETPVKAFAGAQVRIQIPEQASVQEGDNISCKLRGFLNTSSICRTEGPQTLLFPLENDLEAIVTTEFTFHSIFTAPITSKSTDSFIVTVIAADGETIISENKNGFILWGLDPAPIQEATITQVDSNVVASPTSVYFSVTTLNPIPVGGGVQVILPKWDAFQPEGTVLSYIVDEQVNDVCTAKLGVAEATYCSVIIGTTHDYITVKDAFPEGRDAGDIFSFYVSELLNPVSMSPYPIQVLTFSEIAYEDDEIVTFHGQIDQGEAFFIAQEAAQIDPATCAILATDSTVQEKSDFFIPFKVPLPVAEGCIVVIEIPEDFTVKTAEINIIWGDGGIFGNRQQLIPQVDEASRTIKIVDQCKVFSGFDMMNPVQSKIQIQTITNPDVVRETSSFKIHITDKNNRGIASVVSGIKYTPTAGIITDISLESLDGIEVEAETDIEVKFMPLHMVSGDSYILMRLPEQVEFQCILAATSGMKVPPTCTEPEDNLIKLQNPFLENYYPGEEPLSITFQKRVLPGSNEMIRGITIEIYATLDGQDFLVDIFDNQEFEFFAPLKVLFLTSDISSESDTIYTKTKFSLTHTLATSVPFGSIIHIQIPPQIEVADAVSVAESCTGARPLETTLECELTYEDDGWHKLTVSNAFPPEGLFHLDVFTLEIQEGLLTPISVKTSETFKVRITDSNLYDINFVEEALPITMKRGQDVGPIELSVSSEVVGAQTTQNVTFMAPVPLYDGFIIYVFIPEECDPPMESEFTCSSQAPFADDFSCIINGNRITIIVKTQQTVNAVAERRVLEHGEEQTGVQANETVSFEFSPITNPHSMKPSMAYEISIRTSEYYEVARQVTNGPIVENSRSATITDFDPIEALDSRQTALTTITLTWVNTQVYPSDLSLEIGYNSQQIVPTTTERTPQCIFSRTVDVECRFEDSIIKVSNILQTPVYPGQLMSLTITNMQINVTTNIVTDSWTLESFTEDRYAIDKIEGGLSLEYECSFPCNSCDPAFPSDCTSCNVFEDYLILYEGVCYDQCPPGTYYESYQCKPCDVKCKTCTEISSNWCTSCVPGSDFPFLDGNTCTDMCGFGEWGKTNTTAEAECEGGECGQCQECDSRCESCEGAADTCRSCHIDSQIGAMHYFSGTCLTDCPSGYTEDVAANDFVCIPCNINCLICSGHPDICSTCPGEQALNLLDYACVEECPVDITVLAQDEVQGPICEQCDTNCITCSGFNDNCTSCSDNMSLQEDTGKCKLECDEENHLEVAVNGQCEGCTDNCLTCQGRTDSCLTCVEDYFFHSNKCMLECPMINEFQYEPNDEGKCIIPGLQCPFGYSLLDSGDGCELDLSVCLSPNKLNYDRNACVPGSEEFIYFPVLCFCLFLSIIVWISRCTEKNTKIVANLIVFWSFAEIICMIQLIFFATRFGIKPVVYLIMASLLMHYMINCFFSVIFHFQVKQDQAFRHWCTYHQCGITTISIFATIFNFKIYRLIYSRLFNRDVCNASFEDFYMFLRPYNLVSFVNLFTVKVLSLVAAVFATVYVPWGYQLFIAAVEMVVVQVVLLICYVIEYCTMKEANVKKPSGYLIDKKSVDRLRVMAGADDEFSDSDPDDSLVAFGHSDQMKARVQPKSRMVNNVHSLEKILTQMHKQEYAREKGMDTIKEIDQLHEEEIMLRNRRRCRSFRMDRPTVQEAWGSDSDDGCGQNFISEPSSPRSKEMLHNGLFVSRMAQLQRVYKMRDRYDNCYAEAVNLCHYPNYDTQTRSVKVQTNILELLGIDDLMGENSQSQLDADVGSEHYLEAQGIDPNATAQLIDGVIQRIESGDGLGRSDTDPNAMNYSDVPSSSQDKPKKKKRKRMTRRRMAEIPNFDVEEVLGEFETDKNNNHVILKTKDGKLNDRFGRLVNRRGYLIDPAGNIVTRGGIFIFYSEEVDFDDEIPAPYCFQKIQGVQYKVEAFSAFRAQTKKDKISMQDEFIEREYQRLKAQSRQHKELHSQKNPSALALKGFSEASNMGEVISSHQMGLLGRPSSDEDLAAEQFINQNTTDQRKARSKKSSSKRNSKATTSKKNSTKNSNYGGLDEDEDAFIKEIVEPLKAKSKNQLLGIQDAGTEKTDKSASKKSIKKSDKSPASRKSSKGRSQEKSREKKSANASRRSARSGKSGGSQKSRSKSRGRHSNFDNTMRDQDTSVNISGYGVPGTESDGPVDDELKFKDLVFEGAEKSVNTSKAHKPSKLADTQRPGNRRQVSAKHRQNMLVAVTGQNSMQVYENELDKLRQQQRAVRNDDEFIRKMDMFNHYVNQKKQQYQQSQSRPRSSTHVNNVPVDDSYRENIGGLRQQNLNQIYGRVRQKFNKQIRIGATLKFKQPESQNQDEAGMQPDLSLASLQQKLNEHDLPSYARNSKHDKFGKRLVGAIDKDMHKFNKMADIYSNYKTELTYNDAHITDKRHQGPKSHHNAHFTQVQSQMIDNTPIERQNVSSGKVANADLSYNDRQVGKNATQPIDLASSQTSQLRSKIRPPNGDGTGKERGIPQDLLHGRFL